MTMLIFDQKQPENFASIGPNDVFICVNNKLVMSIPARTALRFANTFGRGLNAGFYVIGNYVRLNHIEGRISFTLSQAKRLVDLIRIECKAR